MNRVIVGVIANIMFFQSLNHIAPPALFEHSGFLTDELESGRDAPGGQHFRQPFRGVVIGGQ